MSTWFSPSEVLLQLAAAIAVWVVASIPAYWLHSAFGQARESLSGALTAFVGFLRTKRGSLADAATQRRQQLLAALKIFEVDRSVLNAWNQTTTSILSRMSESDAIVESARKTCAAAVGQVESAYSRASFPVADIREAVIKVPPDEWTQRRGKHRIALVNFLLALVLLVAIVATNAQLTGLVLRELLPAVQPILGIPVPYAIAWVIVLAEAGFGFIHAEVVHSQSDQARKLTGTWLLWSGAAAGVVLLEAWLYSLITPKAVFSASVSSGGFSFVGGLLGLAVFGLGSLCLRNVFAMIQQQTAGAAARQITRLNSGLERLGRLADDTRPKRDDAIAGLQQLLASTREVTGLKVESSREFAVRIEAARSSPPAWAQPIERPLTMAELTEKEARAYFWTVLAIVSLVLLAGGGSLMSVRLLPSLGSIVGVSLGLLALGLGVVTGQFRVDRRTVRVALQVFVASAVVLATVYASRLLSGVYSGRAFLLIPPSLLAFTSGSQMGSSLAILAMALWRLYRELLLALLLLGLAALWLLLSIVRVIEFLFGVIAWPTILALKFVRQRSEATARAT